MRRSYLARFTRTLALQGVRFMPNKEFLETYPLYRRFNVDNLPNTADRLPKPQINMPCLNCKSNQTFVMTNECWEGQDHSNYPNSGLVFRARYLCVHCQKFERHFLIRIDENRQSLIKVGQYPAWEITGDAEIERLLGDHSHYYNR